MAPMRVFGAAAVCASAVRAGTIDSSSGSASVTPVPRRNVRRERCRLVMNISMTPPALAALAKRFDGLLRRRDKPQRHREHIRASHADAMSPRPVRLLALGFGRSRLLHALQPHLKRHALDDSGHERREPVL